MRNSRKKRDILAGIIAISLFCSGFIIGKGATTLEFLVALCFATIAGAALAEIQY